MKFVVAFYDGFDYDLLGACTVDEGKTKEEIIDLCGLELAITEEDCELSPLNGKYCIEDLYVFDLKAYDTNTLEIMSNNNHLSEDLQKIFREEYENKNEYSLRNVRKKGYFEFNKYVNERTLVTGFRYNNQNVVYIQIENREIDFLTITGYIISDYLFETCKREPIGGYNIYKIMVEGKEVYKYES